MKKVLFTTILLLATISLFGQTQKIGYVDSQVIMAQYPAAIKAKSDLEALVTEWRATSDNMRREFQVTANDYQKKIESMTDEAKQAAQQDLIQREQAIGQFEQQKFGQNGELYMKEAELMAPVKEKIFAAIEAVAKEEGMKFIFDKTGEAFLLYADDTYDMTFKVLDKLKRGK